MSDSLISRKAVMEEIHNFVEAHRNDDEVSWTGLDWLLKEDDVVAMIGNVPTAYDVDKVVEQLERESIICNVGNRKCIWAEGNQIGCEECVRRSAVKIVKGGGVDEAN